MLLISLSNCKTTEKFTEISKSEVSYLDSLLQPEPWTYWNKPERPTRIITWQLVHQKINAKIEPSEHKVEAQTDLILVNTLIGQKNLVLDAINLNINSIVDLKSAKKLAFKVDSASISIDLTKAFSKGDTLIVRVDYSVEYPEKGITFVNVDGYYSDQPTQIWTQNEASEIRYWLPTLDHPSQRSTVEFWLNVPDSLETIATGISLEQKEEANHRRTDYWALNHKQAPYLWGFVIGKFAKSTKIINSKPVFFYTDLAYEKYHSIIYKDVDKMLGFMENFTGKPYPFDVLRFVPIHEFESAGMENSGMITLFDGVQFDSVAHYDINNNSLLLHEIAHHWFGNTVTVNEWADISLQEGLVSWFELEYAKLIGGKKLRNEEKWWQLKSYLEETQRYRRPIITNRYDVEDDLFDAHTYQKGALVFDALYNEIGEVRFKEVVKEWLKVNPSQVNLYSFQKIAEREAGKSLNKFFEQWFLKSGHPKIAVSINSSDSTSLVHLKQVQSFKNETLFDLALPITYVSKSGQKEQTIRFNSQDTTFILPFKVEDVWVDPEFTLPLELIQELNTLQINARLVQSPFMMKMQALHFVAEAPVDTSTIPILKKIVYADENPLVKSLAMQVLQMNYSTQLRDFLMDYLVSDEPGRVRILALYSLAQDSAREIDALMEEQLAKEPSYFIQAEMLKIGLQRNKNAWISLAEKYAKSNSYENVLRSAVAQGLFLVDTKQAFDIVFDLANSQVKAAYIVDALETLSGYPLEQNYRTKELMDLYKRKTLDPNLSVKLVAFGELAKQANQKEWVETQLNLLPKEEQEWLRKTLDQTNSLEIEVEQN